MLSVESRAELLVLADALIATNAFRAVIEVLSALDDEDLIAEPWLAWQLALAHYRLDNRVETAALLGRLMDRRYERGLDRLYRRVRTLEGALLHDAGRYIDAQEVFREVLHSSIVSADPYYEAYSTLNLGGTLGALGEWLDAAFLLKRAVVGFEQLGMDYAIAQCHQNLGIVYRELGHTELAHSHLEEAFQRFGDSGVDVEFDVSAAESERALCFMLEGDFDRAEAAARRALARVETLRAEGYPAVHHRGEALRIVGVVLTAKGEYVEAKECLEGALVCVQESHNKLLEAETYEAFSRMATAEGTPETGAHLAELAANLYFSIGAVARAARVRS